MRNPLLRKVVPLLAAGLLLLALAAYAAQTAPTDLPAHAMGVIKSIDAKAQTFVLESNRPGFGGMRMPGGPGGPQDQSGAGPGTFLRGEESAASDNTTLTVATTKATKLYRQSPGTLKDCAVGKWARVMKQANAEGKEVVMMVTLLPEELAQSEGKLLGAPQGGGPGPRAGLGQGPNQNQNQGQGMPSRPGGREIGKITNLTPFTIKLNDGTEKSVAVSAETRVTKTETAAFSDLKVGKRVMVVGKKLANGDIEATQIMLQPEMKRPGNSGNAGGPGEGQTPPPPPQ